MGYFLFPYSLVYYFQNYAYISLDSCSMFVAFLIKYLQGSILEISCDMFMFYVYISWYVCISCVCLLVNMNFSLISEKGCWLFRICGLSIYLRASESVSSTTGKCYSVKSQGILGSASLTRPIVSSYKSNQTKKQPLKSPTQTRRKQTLPVIFRAYF